MSNAKPKTARSYRGAMVDDNAVISINIKWLVQMSVALVGLVYSYYQVISRIDNLERRVDIADESITELVEKHIEEELALKQEMEERISFFEKELNLNPFSWKRKKK